MGKITRSELRDALANNALVLWVVRAPDDTVIKSSSLEIQVLCVFPSSRYPTMTGYHALGCCCRRDKQWLAPISDLDLRRCTYFVKCSYQIHRRQQRRPNYLPAPSQASVYTDMTPAYCNLPRRVPSRADALQHKPRKPSRNPDVIALRGCVSARGELHASVTSLARLGDQPGDCGSILSHHGDRKLHQIWD